MKIILVFFQLSSNENGWSKNYNVFGQLLVFILFLCALVYFAYILKKYSGKISGKKNANLQVVETISISYQNYLQIIKVCDEYILIGVNKNNITFLTKLDNPAILELDKTNIDFKNHFDNYVRKILKKD